MPHFSEVAPVAVNREKSFLEEHLLVVKIQLAVQILNLRTSILVLPKFFNLKS